MGSQNLGVLDGKSTFTPKRSNIDLILVSILMKGQDVGSLGENPMVFGEKALFMGSHVILNETTTLYNFVLLQEFNPGSSDKYRRQGGQVNDSQQTGFSCDPDITGGKRCVSTCDSSRSRY